jgi:cytochrome P450
VYGSGNRDPNRFKNPDQVDLEREDNEHIGYSSGIHLCFGGPLARLEVQIAVGEFVRRVKKPTARGRSATVQAQPNIPRTAPPPGGH